MGLDNYVRMVNVWRHVGYTTLLLFAGLQAIPQHLYTVAVTTMGGPANATNVLQYYIHGSAFGRFQFGYASTMSVALLIVLTAITVLQYRLTRAGRKKGIDVTAFTEPVADYAADVLALMRPAMQDIYANDAPVSGLNQTNSQINLILGQ